MRFSLHLRLLAALAISLLSLISTPAATAEKIPGQSTFGTERYIEYLAGDLPIVLTAPHGGTLRPAALPDRPMAMSDSAQDVGMKLITRSYDLNTQELARAVADELLARTGHRPHLVVSLLHRRKLDPNRDLKEAAAGDPGAERAWREFHAYIESALVAAVAKHGFAFLIDVHGHAHPIARLELGYGPGAAQLNQSDTAFDAAGFTAISTLRDLHARLGGSGAALIRGPRSLGDLFQQRGLRAVPSPQEPRPDQHPFFSGGYIVHRHAAAPATSKVDGVQIEAYRDGIRDTAASRARFAKITADVLAIFLHERYDYDLPTASHPAPHTPRVK
jgi:hypothetical protein